MASTLTLDSRKIKAPVGTVLFDLAEQLNVTVPTSCHKQGKCRECLVEVTAGMEHLSPREPEEQHLDKSFRLACRCRINSENGVINCHTLRRNRMRVEQQGRLAPLPSSVPPLEPAVVRERGDRILLEGREIARSHEPPHGLAIDIGTTTCVVRLLNLETGKFAAATTFENPQRFGGSNIMARIQYDGLRKDRLLQRTLLAYLSHVIKEFPVDSRSIHEAVITGNSTMRDLFFGLDVHAIGQEPFQSITETEYLGGSRHTTAIETSARKLGLPMNPDGRVYGMPLISGHVGADAAACMLAVGMPEEDRIIAIMDVGTNTELIVGNKNNAIAASCPAGPAFEGGSVTAGMPALEGAIEKIAIHKDGRIVCQVIGGGPPEGICGSGLIDLLSELLRTGTMNVKGRFNSPFIVDQDSNIEITEADVNELALAKGANVAGLSIVLQNLGLEAADIEIFYLAGAFGRHLDTDAAARIGMIPSLEKQRFQQIGNAAIEGATTALLSLSHRRSLEALIHKTTHIRLESDPRFFDAFVDGCLFTSV